MASDFGVQTPRTIDAVLTACWKTKEWQNESALTQAWMTARLSLTDPKKFPTLDKLLGKSKTPKAMDPEALLGAVRSLKSILKGDTPNG